MKTYNLKYTDNFQLDDFIISNGIDKYSNILIQIFSGCLNEELLLSISQNIKMHLPESEILGTTTAGEIYEGKMYDEQIIISFSVFSNTSLRSNIYKIEDENINFDTVIEDLVTEDTKVLIVFSDGLQSNGEDIIKEISLLKPELTVAGGRAGDNQQFKRTFIFNETCAFESGFVIASLSSKDLIVHNSYMLNWQTIGQDMVVTKSKGNCLREINHTKVIDIYKKYLGEDIADNLPFSGIEFPLVFEKDGISIARAPIAVLDDGSFIFGGNLEVGTKVRFGFGDPDTMKEDSYKSYEKLKNIPIESIFIYSCSARKALMNKELEVEFGLLQSIAPSAGYFTYGEYYHNNNSNDLLNITTTFLSLSEKGELPNIKKIEKNYTKKNRTLNALTHLLKTTSKELDDTHCILNHAQNISSIGSWDWDIKNNTLWWSDEVYNILNIDKYQFKATYESFLEYIYPDDLETVKSAVKVSLDDKNIPYDIEHRIISKDGKIKVVREKAEIFRDNMENPVRMTGVIQDITQHYEIQKQLKDNEFRWKFAVEGSGDGLWDWDLATNNVYYSTRWKEMLGYQEDEINDSLSEWERLVHPDDLKNAYMIVEDYLKGNTKHYTIEIRMLCKDSSYKWILARGMIVKRDDNGDPLRVIGTHTDISHQKKIAQELLAAKEAAEKANSAKSEFLANMSHEIRTPLNAIMGFVDLLQEKEEDKKKQEYLSVVNSASSNLLEIINDILDFSKVESGKLDIEKNDFNPFDEFQITKKLFKAKADEKRIYMHVSYNELPKSLKGDILRIKQVINNLISNAIKFTPNGKNIFLDIDYKDGYLNVNVKDEGIGISKEYQSRIFEPFSQEDGSTTRKYGGTGLGLTISHNLVKEMSGELKLKSEVGKGSEFYFSIPLECGEEIIKKDITTNNITFDANILLVEDNKANQMFMKVVLQKMNIKFDIANDGIEAIDKFKSTKYDLILMDENMPNMNGIETTKYILQYEKEHNMIHTPIIALTANAVKGDRERFLEAGMDEYLAKPLDKNKLNNIFNKTLNKSLI